MDGYCSKSQNYSEPDSEILCISSFSALAKWNQNITDAFKPAQASVIFEIPLGSEQLKIIKFQSVHKCILEFRQRSKLKEIRFGGKFA